jgi:hypothetical protein
VPDDNQNKDILIDGLLARETLIRTGTFVFKHGSMVIKDYGNGQPWSWEESNIPYTAELTIAGDEWVLRWPTTPIVSMHRRDFSATYTETPQPDDKEIYRSLVITDPSGVHSSLEEECKSDPLFCILKAGAIPSAQMSEFMEKHRNRIEYLGEKTINDIKTQILQIRIPKKEFSDVMPSIHPVYLKQDAMLITYYIAPQLTYSAIRIEYSTSDGYMTKRYEATDFEEVAIGIFFPKCYCTISNFTKNGQGYYIHQYLVSQIKNVNKHVQESDFEMAIPEGARVRDSRPGSGDIVFYIDKNISFSKADELIKKNIAPTKRNYFRIICFTLSAIFFILLFYMSIRNRILKSFLFLFFEGQFIMKSILLFVTSFFVIIVASVCFAQMPSLEELQKGIDQHIHSYNGLEFSIRSSFYQEKKDGKVIESLPTGRETIRLYYPPKGPAWKYWFHETQDSYDQQWIIDRFKVTNIVETRHFKYTSEAKREMSIGDITPWHEWRDDRGRTFFTFLGITIIGMSRYQYEDLDKWINDAIVNNKGKSKLQFLKEYLYEDKKVFVLQAPDEKSKFEIHVMYPQHLIMRCEMKSYDEGKTYLLNVDKVDFFEGICYPKKGTFHEDADISSDSKIDYQFEVTNVSRYNQELVKNWFPEWPPLTAVHDIKTDTMAYIPPNERQMKKIADQEEQYVLEPKHPYWNVFRIVFFVLGLMFISIALCQRLRKRYNKV